MSEALHLIGYVALGLVGFLLTLAGIFGMLVAVRALQLLEGR